MDQQWIDSLARNIERSLTRRGMVAGVLGALGAASLGTGFDPAVAKKRKKKRKKKPPTDSTSCGSGQTRCNAACVNLTSDKANCGACGSQCGPEETCCGGTCRDTRFDAAHCGACGAACAQGQVCANSACFTKCGEGVCPAGSSQPDCCADTCTNVQDNPAHCGRCDNACTQDETCCGDACANLNDDANHCGACSAACPQGESCQEGHCGAVCGAGDFCRADSQKPVCCQEACINTDRDRNNCGACGHACGETERCWEGVCVCGDVCHNGCQFADIQAAITAAQDGDTVRVCPGTYNGAISISKRLTLVGAGNGANGTFIQGRNGASTVTVNRPAEIRGFTITGGIAHQWGGGINSAADLTVVDCTISHNTAVMSGGGIANLGFGLLSLRNCTIEHNDGNREGGGIWNTARMEMTNCLIHHNDATLGGGVYNFWGRQASVTDSVIRENSAGTQGGGIFNGGVLTLSGNSAVTDNDAGTDGGGIFNDLTTNGTVQRDGATSIRDNEPNDCANTPACSA